MKHYDAIIIGAGITGLSLSFYLKGQSTLILERSNRAGGSLHTLRKEDYQLELGANSFLLKGPGRELLEQLSLQPIPVNRTERYLALGTPPRLQRVPTSPGAFVRSAVLSARGKARILREPFQKRTTSADTSVLEFISRRFGREVAENLIAPIFSGIYASDIAQLSARSALPTLYQLEQIGGSLFMGGIRTLLARNEKKKEKRVRPEMVQFAGGMSSLVGALAEQANLRLGSSVLKIELAQRPYQVTTNEAVLTADSLYFTGDAKSTGELFQPFDPELATQLASIPYSPVGLLYLSSPEFQSLSGVGFLAQPAQGRALLGALYTSSSFPHTAPAGHPLITCFLGGLSNPGLADATQPEIQQRAIRELSGLLNLRSTPTIIHSVYWPRAIPSYPLHHYRLQEKLHALEQQFPGIHFLGNWLEKPGVADCIERAQRAAKANTA